MDIEFLQELQNRYAPIISNLIASNINFYRFKKTIKWQFYYDERVSIFGYYSDKTDILSVNICFVDFAFKRQEPLQIEYFLLHEIRHVFQFLEISDFKEGKETCIDSEIIKKWISENENYCAALNEDGNENPAYFKQDMEFDAYAYSYAVMKYKYGDISYLYKPTRYGDEFDETVENWCKTFQAEQL